MKAVCYEEFGGELKVCELAEPEVIPGGMVVKVEAAGVCRSDWHGWMGHDDDIRELPHVPGHEFAGEVVAVGAGVERVRVGERVTVPFVCGCGVCGECGSGNAQVCPAQYQPGFSGRGSFAELVGVPAADFNAVVLPDAVGSVEAAVLGCRMATAFRALAHADQGAVREGERVVVFGCGGVGLSAVLVAKALGAEVVAVDLEQAGVEAALALGADEGVCGSYEGEADVTVDAVGSAGVLVAALGCLRARGRHVQVGLLLGKDEGPRVPMGRVIAKELRVVGSHGMAAVRYPEMLAMVADGRLPVGKLVGRRLRMEEVGGVLVGMGANVGSGGVAVWENSPESRFW